MCILRCMKGGNKNVATFQHTFILIVKPSDTHTHMECIEISFAPSIVRSFVRRTK